MAGEKPLAPLQRKVEAYGLVSLMEFLANRRDQHGNHLFCGDFCGLLYCKSAQNGERCAGCHFDDAIGASSYRSWLFIASHSWAEENDWGVGFVCVWIKTDYDMVVRDLCDNSGDLSTNVSYGAWGF